jgi:Ca-activated chloride channel family protein
MNKQPRYSRRPRWQKHLPLALLLGAVACVGLALAQFRLEQTATQGTVILTLDTSKSMDEIDVVPSRIAAATVAARAFIARLPEGYPVGLVTFAGEATVVVEPTLEHAKVDAALGALPLGKGTVIGDGLATTLDLIESDREANGERPSAVILLSDGIDTGSAVPPLDAATRAADMGVPVFTVVLGALDTEGGANAGLLQEIASRTDGTSATAATAGQLTAVYEGFGTQLSTDLAIGGTGPLFILAGVFFAVAAGVAVLLASRSEY